MESQHKAWVTAAAILAVCIISIAVCVTAYYMHRNELICRGMKTDKVTTTTTTESLK